MESCLWLAPHDVRILQQLSHECVVFFCVFHNGRWQEAQTSLCNCLPLINSVCSFNFPGCCAADGQHKLFNKLSCSAITGSVCVHTLIHRSLCFCLDAEHSALLLEDFSAFTHTCEAVQRFVGWLFSSLVSFACDLMRAKSENGCNITAGRHSAVRRCGFTV